MPLALGRRQLGVGLAWRLQTMSRAAKSLLVFGVYLTGLGMLLLIFPNVLLRIFGVPATNEIWIRVNGMFVICFAYYYIQTARHG